MTEIIAVRFKSGGKQYYFDPKGKKIALGQGVILETTRGIEYGECVQENTMVEDHTVVKPLRPVVRIATAEDEANRCRNKEREEKAFHICVEKIEEHKLDMKLVEVEFSFDGSKILFFFTSEGRVDFRNLVKDLAGIFHTRIELRQIGVRDEAKMLGGLGICGRPFCCSQFLEDFQPVSIKMAKTQSLSLNPTKISGTCGRLMCCLKYEQDAYEDAVRRCPKQESFVETPDGPGNVVQVNLLREKVKVRLENTSDPAKVYHNCEVRVIRNGKGKRPEDYVAPPLSQLEKLRFVPEVQEEILPIREKSSLSAALEEVFNHTVAPSQPRGEGEGRGNNRNRRRRGGEGKPKTEVPAPKAPEAKPAQPKPNKPAGGRGPKPGKPGEGNRGGKPPINQANRPQQKPKNEAVKPKAETNKPKEAPNAGKPTEGKKPFRPRRRRPSGPKPKAE